MAKVLVTGANGFLATHVIINLLNKGGYSVRGLLRNKKSYKADQHERLELMEGSFNDPQCAERAVAGCDYVIHVAAVTAQNLLRYDEYKRINVDATDALVKLSVANQVKRFVFVSSANTVGHCNGDVLGSEQMPMREPFLNSFYARSKAEAEAAVMSYKESIDVVVVNPSFMIGSYGTAGGSNQVVEMVLRNKIVPCPPGGKSFIGVEDAARGVVAALEIGRSGEKYLLTGENLTYKQFFKRVAALSDCSRSYITVPKPLLISAGCVGSLLRKMGLGLSLSSNNTKILCVSNYYDNSKSKDALSLQYSSIDDAIKQAINYQRSTK